MADKDFKRPTVILFDVNETLLDLNPLRESVDSVLLESDGAELWFNTMLQYSLVMTVNNQFAPLPEIGAATLKMLARNREVSLSDEQAKEALEPMRTLAPHPDVRAALERLRTEGFRLATLTNSAASGAKAQLDHAGLADCFDKQMSVETIGKYKPHPEVYLWAASEMQAEPGQCMLVAAHGWDIAGAGWAGLSTGFIARWGNQEFPLAKPADIVASDLGGLAEKLAALPA